MSIKSILVIHGPNLNMLGKREPEHYGSLTLEQINAGLELQALNDGITLSTFQSNSEADLVNKIHTLSEHPVDFIIINPAAYTHTSIAIRDALSVIKTPFIEVHLSNVHAREPFRRKSYFSDIAVGVICGLGAAGYSAAYQYAKNQ
jgi:3-dehydroquinate dehydratase II